MQHVKIYLPCNFEVNPITHFDRLCKLEKRGDEIKKKSSPLKLLGQSQPNFAEMILRWSPFKIVSVSAALYPRWLPLLKLEISSNGQNCCWSYLPFLYWSYLPKKGSYLPKKGGNSY